MLKIVKVGGVSAAAGVFVGLGIVGWLYWHRSDDAVSAKPGSMALGAETTPSPDPSDVSLKVAGTGKDAAGGGGAQSLLPGGSSSGSGSGSSGSATPAPYATPSPSELSQYEKYAASTTAMFGDLTVGQGTAIAVGSIATVNYRGWLTNGTLFDESYTKGKTFSFKEGDHHVIAGWEEGLLGMKAGGRRRVIVPASQGYGAQEHAGIPANSLLVFDVELVSVQ